MTMITRLKNAARAFARVYRDTPSREQVALSTKTMLPHYERGKTLSFKALEDIRRNPYVYSALRNTAAELAGKWNGAKEFVAQKETEKHLERPGQILAASDLPLHQQQADHLRWNVDHRIKRGWNEVIKQIVQARVYGKSVQEVMWTYQPNGPYRGSWVIDDIHNCIPQCFDFRYDRRTNELTGEVYYERKLLYNPNGSGGGTPVEDHKFLVYSFDKRFENEDGDSILNKLDLFDWYQNNNFAFWMTDLNRYGSPMIVGTTPRGAGVAQREALLKAIDSVQQETGIVIDETEKLELLQAQRNGAAGFELLNQIVNYIIAVVITGHTSSMENSRYGGTYGQARATTSEIREILLYDLATDVDSVINRQLVYWWYVFNYPRTQEFAKQQLLPPRPRESSNQVQDSEALGNPYVSSSLSFSESGDDPQDKLCESAIDESLTVFESVWIDPLKQLIREANDPEDARVKLDLFRPDEDAYADLLHRTFVSAHVSGRWAVRQAVPVGEQFAETLSDREVTRLLESPILVSRAREIVLQKALMTKREFNRLDDSAKRKAFTVSGQESESIMAQIRQAVADAIQEGATLRDIERAAMDAFHRYGVTWQTPYHAATVFRTNIESAFADAQWAMMQEPETREQIAYLEYLTENDTKVRPNHRKMHGVIRPIGDPVWQIWWTPNGYNCRCRIRIITWEEAQRRNIQPTPTLPNVQPDPGFSSGPGSW